MSSWSTPSPETPMRADELAIRDRSARRPGKIWMPLPSAAIGAASEATGRRGTVSPVQFGGRHPARSPEHEADVMHDRVVREVELNPGGEHTPLAHRLRERPERVAVDAVGIEQPRENADRARREAACPSPSVEGRPVNVRRSVDVVDRAARCAAP